MTPPSSQPHNPFEGDSSLADATKIGPAVPDQAESPMLGEADARAIDALIEMGFEASDSASTDARTKRAVSLLSLLHMPIEPSHEQRELLIDVTVARVARAAGLGLNHGADAPPLCAADERAVDAYVQAGYDAAAVQGDDAPRADRIDRLLSLVGVGTEDTRPGEGELVERTLAAVDEEVRNEEDRLKFEPAQQQNRGRGRRAWQFADVVAAAAILLIGGAVLTPVMSMLRDYAMRAGCFGNMQAAGMGLASYAGDYKDSFPLASASTPGTTWWHVGVPERSNSANLYTVSRTGYVKPAALACGGNPLADGHAADRLKPDSRDWQRFEDVSYSFQNLFANQRPTWTQNGQGRAGGVGGGRVVVLTDRSPVTIRARAGHFINPYANSPNHDEQGQNVLFNDGSAQWATSPVLQEGGGDNIWLPRSIESLLKARGRPAEAEPIKGVESPDSRDDVFVGP